MMNDSRSAQPADLLLGHHALDILGLALDAVARAAVRLDRKAANDGIDTALLDVGAALRPLLLVMDVVVDREIMGHGGCSREDGLLGVTASESNKSRGSARAIPGSFEAAINDLLPPGLPSLPAAICCRACLECRREPPHDRTARSRHCPDHSAVAAARSPDHNPPN